MNAYENSQLKIHLRISIKLQLAIIYISIIYKMSQTYHEHTILENTSALTPYYPYDEDDVEHYYSNSEDGGICGVLQNINMSVHYQITVSHPIYFKNLHDRSREIFNYMEDLITFIQFADRFKLYTERNITFLRHLQK